MNVLQKLNSIMSKVSFVHKDTNVGFGNNSFKAVSHDKVTEVTRSHFIEAGVMVIPSQQGKGISVEGMTKNGSAKIRFEAVYDIKFINMDDSSDYVTVSVEAHGEGSDDKCAGKALSYAVKSAMLKVLMLETGENDEEGVKNTIDVKQAGMLAQLIADTDTDIEKFCGAYQIQKVIDLPSGAFSTALSQLQTKLKKGKQ
jgi:hypothetical protein